MAIDCVRNPAPVLRGHPLLVAPVVAVAIGVRAAHGAAAAQLAFVVAAGGVLVIELAVRLLVRATWSRHLWPPTQDEPAGLVPPMAGGAWAAAALWAAGRLGEGDAVAVGAGVRGCLVAVAIQLAACLVPMTHRRPAVRNLLRTARDAGAR